MDTLIVYSSLTGNTEKVAGAIHGAIEGSTLCKVGEAPDAEGFELVVVGFWVDRGEPDAKTKAFLEKVKNKKTAFFFTLGAYPHSEHADDVARVTGELLAGNGNTVLGSYRCQGKVDPVLLERMKKMLPPDHPHAQMTDERKARLEEAARHPNEDDCRAAAAFAAETLKKALEPGGSERTLPS
ncbi:MAG: flavodoxin family protein [Deltaproteobacteria bacterium]|jgi:flavodoxin|nr:flavodoxin family protein [Deltaproteobacteria bacterium]